MEQPSCKSSRTTFHKASLLASGELAVGARQQTFERQARDNRIDVIGCRVVARHLFEKLARTHHTGQCHFLHHYADAPASVDFLRRMAEQFGRAFVRSLQS
jgi:hypothetical protein